MAIGCIVSLVIEGIADRYFAAEEVLVGLNITTSILLLLAGLQSNPDIFFIMLLFAMLAYMPIRELMSAIIMSHSSSEQFPRIRLTGSVGWVALGYFSIAYTKIFNIGFNGTNFSLFCGAVLLFIVAIVNLTLSSTPSLAKG